METNDELKKLLKDYWCLIIIILGIPLVVGYFMNHGIFSNFGGGDSNGWLGFWGGYLGTVVSIPFSIWISIRTIHEENQRNKNNISESKDNELKIEQIKRENQKFDNILNYSTRYQVEISKFNHWEFPSFIPKETVIELSKIVNSLLNEKHDIFLTEFNVNRSRLAKEKRDIFKDKIEYFATLISNLRDSQSLLQINIEEYNKSETNNEDSPIFKNLKNIQSKFEKVENLLGEIADICLAQIKYK